MHPLKALKAASFLRLDTQVRDWRPGGRSREPPTDCRVVWGWERGTPRHPPPGKPQFPPQPQGPGLPAAPLGPRENLAPRLPGTSLTHGLCR